MNRATFALALATPLLLGACAVAPPRAAGFGPTLPPPPAPPAASPDGAIFQASAGYAPLYYGNRAARVGDIVTVVLVESTRTNKSAGGRTDRSGAIALSPPSTGPFSFDPNALNTSASASFRGQGDASQASSLVGEVTVSIAEVLPNGTAIIKGEKLMRFSQGDEWVQLSGIIRLADIDAFNRIPSPRVADARIAYSGQGAVQTASRPGWLARFFSAVAPF